MSYTPVGLRKLSSPSPEAGTTGNNSQDRIAQLTQKFSTLQQGLEDERALRVQALEARLLKLAQFADRIMEEDQKQNKAFWDELKKVEQEVEAERQSRLTLNDSLAREVQVVDARTHLGLELEQKGRCERESAVRSKLGVGLEAVQRELEADAQATEDMQRRQAATLANKMPQLLKELGVERTSRETAETRIIAQAQEEINSLRLQIQKERKMREEMEESMLKQLETTVSTLQGELGMEKKARKKVEESLLTLMEAVTAKFTELTSLAEA